MALSARVKRLERTARERPAAPCRVCGSPLGWVPSLEVWNDAGEVLTPRCPACGFGLNSEGRPMTALPPGSDRKVIILHRLPAG